jgi:hypothetical protein
MANKEIKSIHKTISDNTDKIVRVIAVIIFLWFVTGIILVDILHPVIFITIYIPLGLLGAWWARKW